MQIRTSGTLVTRLHDACNGKHGITFLHSRDNRETLSYVELRRQALLLLDRLNIAGLEPGDEVVIQVRNDRDFLVSFWACLLGRLIAVPLAVSPNAEHRRKVHTVWGQLDNPFLLADTPSTLESIVDFVEDAQTDNAEEISARSLVFGDPPVADSDDRPLQLPGLPSPDEIALIQFSSGSTGEPKGVIVTHRAAVVNTSAMIERLKVGDTDRYLSWMPLTHDFGIIGMHLTPLAAGIDQVQIPTQLFVRSPMTWFHAVNEYRATIVASPNFGYRHFLKFFSPDAATQWDLGSVRILQNGAEPISPSLCHEFLDTLAPYRLDPAAMLPGYGLAEATLAVSYALFEESVPTVILDRDSVGPGEKVVYVDPVHESAVEFVDVGFPVPSMEIRITDDSGVPVPDGMVGTIEIRGESVTSGYYNNPVATAKVVREDGWLDTGDLGFLQSGRLVITGRAKDIIFSGGINYYPHDLERVALELDGIDVNKIAVTGLQNGVPEEIAAFVYFKRSIEEFFPVASGLRAHILRTVGLHIDYVVPVTSIPKTTSGKVQRYALARRLKGGDFDREVARLEELWREEERRASESLLSTINNSTPHAVHRQIRATAEEIVGVTIDDETKPFVDYGFDSVRAVELRNRLSTLFRVDLPVSLIFDYPDLTSLAETIYERVGLRENVGRSDDGQHRSRALAGGDSNQAGSARETKIAIVGVGIRLPGGVNSLGDLQDLLESGVDAIGEAPSWRWGEGESDVRPGGYRDDVEFFDNTLFGISPKEAEWIDPQHRFLLETTWEAIEDSNINPVRLRNGSTGVFVGISSNGYARRWDRGGCDLTQHSLTGTLTGTAPGRISYTLGLDGPCLAVDTACSSSLAAIHLAVESLRSGESDFAIAGGVSLILDRAGYDALEQTGALAPDGRCKAFGEDADGYGRGEGCGIVLLRRLEDAARDGDPVHGVILGSAMNHDGRSNGLTAPNGLAQERVIRRALLDAGCDPDRIGYVEAHGTGTRLGDPQEITALGSIFSTPSRQRPLPVGSIKSNIGHLESAAGMAGLFRVLASFRAGKVFGSLNSRPANSHIPWDRTPVRVPAEAEEWREADGVQRVAGISAFGMSGTNLHLVVAEDTVEVARSVPSVGAMQESEALFPETFPVLLPFSAANAESLEMRADNYARFISEYSGSVRRLAATAATGRADLAFRGAVVGADREELLEALSGWQPVSSVGSSVRRSAWLFTGQGSQYFGMGGELYRSVGYYREMVDRCSAHFEPYLGYHLGDLLGGAGSPEELSLPIDVDQTANSQPLIFTLQYSLASLLMKLGLRPNVVGGHSIGEYAAATIAGALSLEDAIRLVARRGASMQSVPEQGSMVAFFCSESAALSMIDKAGEGTLLSIAAVNGADSVVVSGRTSDIDRLCEIAGRDGVESRSLNVSHAFHSPLMDPAVEEFSHELTSVSKGRLSVPFVSSMTGRTYDAGESIDPEYWRQQIAAPVRFTDMVRAVQVDKVDTILEIGGNPVLCGLGQGTPEGAGIEWVPTLRRGSDDRYTFMRAVAGLYSLGHNVDWERFYPEGGDSRIDLPSYPWRKKRYWIDYPETSTMGTEMRKSVVGDEAPGNKSSKRVPVEAGTLDRQALLRQTMAELCALVGSRTGYPASEIAVDRDLFELGVDSLVLMQVRQNIAERYDVQLEPSVFYSDASVQVLANRIVDKLEKREREKGTGGRPSATMPGDPEENFTGKPPEPSQSANSNGEIEEIIRQQLRLMSDQLELLRRTSGVQGSDEENQPEPAKVNAKGKSDPAPATFVPYREISRTDDSNPIDQYSTRGRYVERLIDRYCSMTGGSKEATDRFRPAFANNRNVAGFRPSWKELIYQLQVDRASGSRVQDIDGNEFIDLTMGFGVNLFGHNPEFIRRVLEDRLATGISVGPMSPLAGPVAERLSRLTGVERSAFYNSGTEAIMVALRLARGATGRRTVVIFSGSYHGTFDGVLALPGSPDPYDGSHPLAPGVTPGMVSDVIVLPYGTDESLAWIREHAVELAAVLVEPVQSRRPDFQPREFLVQLRDATSTGGAALIFDEVITGFRIHPGGAQAHFGVTADIAVYGKVVGGGMPIGIVAGRRKFLDLVDGGMWQFGDSSVPQVRNTFVAGTFCHHPLAMAATDATLAMVEMKGMDICGDLNRKTARFAESLNAFFVERGLSLRVVHFGSLFRFVLGGDWELLYFALLTRGVYVWEGRNCFFSTEHSDADIEQVRLAVVDSVTEMVEAGFAPAVQPSGRRSELLPMSSVQRRLYAIAATPAGELAYHINGVLRFTRGFDRIAAEAAFRRIINRNEGLRTGFIADDGELFQRIEPAVEFEIADLELAPGETIAERFASAVTPFDLSTPPLFRAFSVTTEGGTALLLDMHHIAGDGTALELIAGEFLDLYREFSRSGEWSGDREEEDPVQYREFVEWETRFYRSEEYRKQEEFWKEILSIPTERINLPVDFTPPSGSSFRGAQTSLVLPAEGLSELAKRHRSSIYMIVLAIYGEFLRRISGEPSFRIGIVHAGRSSQRFSRTIGMFANSLLVPVRIDPEESFGLLLQRLKERTLEIFDNVDYPFEHLVKLDPDVVRDQRISLSYEELNVSGSEGVEFEPAFDLALGRTTSDLNLNVIVTGENLYLQLQYSTDLFTRDTAERLTGFLHRLVEGIAADPDRSIGDHAIVSEEEWGIILGNEVEGPPVESLVDFITLFNRQAKSSPSAPAIYFDRDREGAGEPFVLSYRDLDERSDSLAHLLRSRYGIGRAGVSTTEIVAIYLERSPEFIVAILGILKAGGGFLAIEPSLPDSRVAFMLDDADVRVVISSQPSSELVDRSGSEGFVIVDPADVVPVTPFEPESEEITGSFDPRNNPEAVAYMVYTSGSTGEPKGVMVSRRNLANYAFWITRDRVEHVGLTHFSLHISPAFDMMMSQIFPPLASGRAIWIHHPEMPVDRVMERCFSDETPINSVSLTPSHLALMEDFSIERCNVRLVSIGGEVLARRHRDLVASLNPEIQLYNDYGPTEATVSCIAHLVNSDGRVNVIGKPMPNSIAYILDTTLRPCPVGIIGEICVGGAIVAMGYRNRDDLTSERFIDDPFREGQRIYRTGDLGRLLEDGTIEFFGRRDRQIKLHGHRIEIGEIEEVIGSLGGVRTTAVRLEKDEKGDYLAAWIVAQDREGPDEIRAELAGRLPSFMIPSVIMLVDSIPLSRSGKVDFLRLQIPVRRLTSEPEGIGKPEELSDVEREVADVWDELLDVRVTDRDTNFYHAGGDSIKAIRIASRLRSRGYDIDGGSILRFATLGELADELLSRNRLQGAIEDDSIPVAGPIALSPIQRWFFRLDLQHPSHWNQGVLLSFGRDLDVEVLEKTLMLLVTRHDVLRTSFVSGKNPSAEIRKAPGTVAEALRNEVSLHVHDMVASDGIDEVTRLINDAHRRIDIADGPLFSSLLLREDGIERPLFKGVPPGRSYLAICLHHLVVDAVSWSIIIEEFIEIYDAVGSGVEPDLPPRSTSFSEFARTLVEQATSPDIVSEIPYWNSVEEELAGTRSLPVDREIDRRDQGGIVRTVLSFGPDVAIPLATTALRPYNLRPDEIHTAVLALALREWTGRDRNGITVERHGRREYPGIRLDRTVGWFTSTFPIVLECGGTPEEVIVATKERLRGVPGGGIGYSVLSELATPGVQNLPGRGAAPALMFNYLGSLDFEGLPESNHLGTVSVAVEAPGDWIDRAAVQPETISIDLFIRDGGLHWNIRWHRDEFLPETIDRLCESIRTATREVLDCCLGSTGTLTLSDLLYRGFRSSEELKTFLRVNHIEPDQVSTIWPLVPMQEGMYFEYLRNGGRYSQRAQLDLTVRGVLDRDLLEQAWNAVINRYDAFRTAYTMDGSREPVAVVFRQVTGDFRFTEFDGESGAGVESAERILAADWEEGFDLAGGNPIRLRLISIGVDHHRLVLTCDHIVQDGWCIGLVLNGLLESYDLLRSGRSPEVSNPAPSYGRYIEWLEGYDREGGLRYWSEYLEGFTIPTAIPVDRRGSEGAERDPHHDVVQFSIEEVEGIVSTARSFGTTPNIVLRAAWSLVLARTTSRHDLLFGGVVSGRPPEIDRVDEIIGNFINTVPVRVRIDPDATLQTLLQEVAEDTIAGSSWHHTSLTDIYRISSPGEKLFDHILVVENYPLDQELTNGLAGREDFGFESFRFRGDETFDLVVTAMLEISREIRFTYNASVIDSETIRRLGDLLRTILGRIVRNPELSVAEIAELTEAKPSGSRGKRRPGSSLNGIRPKKIDL